MTLLCYNIPVKVKVFAKLNLTLNVGAKQRNFHTIDSVVTSVDIFDIVEVVKRNDLRVKVSGVESVKQEHNTAYKAAVAFLRMFTATDSPISGVDIFIQKGIPFGAGLGGSSADAAAVVYCMCKLFGVDIHSQKIHELCSSIGSDVNFMLLGGLGRLAGKGDDVTMYNLAQPLYFALTTFDESMSSGEIYSAFDALPHRGNGANQCSSVLAEPSATQTDELLNLLQQGANGKAIKLLFNDLQQATLLVSNYAKRYLSFTQSNNLCCNMTGSGSAYYVACETHEQAQQVAQQLNAHGFATKVCTSVPGGIIDIH